MARLGFTTRASCLLAAGATALICGLALGIVDLARAGTLALAVPLLSAVAVLRSRVQITNRRRVEPPRAPAGSPVTVHLELANRSRFPSGALMLEDRLPGRLHGSARFVVDGLLSRQQRTVSYRMPRLPRGHYRVGPLTLRLTDPFHLVDVRRSFASTAEVTITPVIEPIRRAAPPKSTDAGDDAGSHSIGARGADDASTREYRVGDDLRKIHWRSSARTGALMVRQEERPWQGRFSVLLDRRASAHVAAAEPAAADARLTSSFEWAVSAAASLAAHGLVSGRETLLVDDPALPLGHRFSDTIGLGDYLAGIDALTDNAVPGKASNSTSLPSLGASAAGGRETALVAVLGRLSRNEVRLLADWLGTGRATAAAAVLLDVVTWRDPLGTAPDARPVTSAVAAAERTLRAAGWQVVVAACGDPVGDTLRRLLSPTAGTSSPYAAFGAGTRA